MLINWQEWSSKAFAQAKKEQKPVLLSISAVWCHWCHTMDKETYSNSAVIQEINTSFVPIRVDTDLRPDINERYNLGGWPTTALLYHNGTIISGALYLPPDQLLALLAQNKEHAQKQKFYTQQQKPFQAKEKDLPHILSTFKEHVSHAYDPEYGGFGVEPKFPHPEVLLFLLEEYLTSQDKHTGDMLKKTLNSMSAGEFYDKEEGGFFRYATQQNWTIPHFEKMLEDNAQLAEIYARAYTLFGDMHYKTIATETITFLLSLLFDKEQSLFYGSQDADEAYCHLTKQKRKQATIPFIDKRLFVGWNAIALHSLLTTAAHLHKPLFQTIALKGLENLLTFAKTPKGVLHCILEKKTVGPFFSKNAVLLQHVLLKAHELTGNKHYLTHARTLISLIQKSFVQNHILYDITKQKTIGYLTIRHSEITSTGYFIKNLLTLATLTKQQSYKKQAKNLLLQSAQNATQGIFGAVLARAIKAFLYL